MRLILGARLIYPISDSPWVSPVLYCVPKKGGMTVVENEDNELIPTRRLQTGGSTSKKGNPKIHEVIKKEVIKLLYAGLNYPISDSPWVTPVHCVLETDIRQKDKKSSKNRQNRARSGKEWKSVEKSKSKSTRTSQRSKPKPTPKNT
ncbi:hypothetical protein Tco_0131486 [Tanacetum coccineum]